MDACLIFLVAALYGRTELELRRTQRNGRKISCSAINDTLADDHDCDRNSGNICPIIGFRSANPTDAKKSQ